MESSYQPLLGKIFLVKCKHKDSFAVATGDPRAGLERMDQNNNSQYN